MYREWPLVKAAVAKADAEDSHAKWMNRMTQICRDVEYSAAHYWMFTVILLALSNVANVVFAIWLLVLYK